jgi:hypothetical protein
VGGVLGRTVVLVCLGEIHTDPVMNQTPPWMPPPRRSFWSRLTPIQRVGLIGAALLLPLCGGTALAGALTGAPKTTVETPAAEQVADAPAARDTGTTEPATDPAAEAATDPATEAATSEPTTEPTVTRKTVTVRKSIPYATKKVDDDTLAKGRTKVRTPGVAGVRTLTYQVTLAGGKETGRTLVSNVVTKQPVTKVVAVGAKATSGGGNCDPNYRPCVPIASDVDCAGGSGNGPAYVDGPVYVIGHDIYDLARDGDGVGCDT